MALFVSHPVSTRDFSSMDDIGRGLIRDVIRKEPYHIMIVIYEIILVIYDLRLPL
jgi:hypothetical protein